VTFGQVWSHLKKTIPVTLAADGKKHNIALLGDGVRSHEIIQQEKSD
jgi:hypothetical protein